ncbi:hypothetical protein M9H77_03712 [Catharanthus roseus]|uniref:Uncharacterized protein n=1 Tax=Catharanthus roseus TaxID=4058 RepID=A0ACC0CCG9_CATRO|nr:hypothetical protein M9H77_03712 [Catharanthus roseus]
MFVFLLPKTLCNDITSMIRQFWWANGEEKGKRKWDGGIRFRDLEVFNFYLWAKQEWRIMQQLDYVVAQILKAKYFCILCMNIYLGSSTSSGKGLKERSSPNLNIKFLEAFSENGNFKNVDVLTLEPT